MSDSEKTSGKRPAPPIRGGYWAAALAVAGAVFWFNDNYILNHFWHGPYLYDTGWYAGMVYHPTPDLISPPADGANVSFYNTHISPLLVLLGLPSYGLADALPVYYAKVIGVIYGCLGLAGTLAAEPLTRHWGWRGPLAAAVVGLGLAFSGISLIAIGYPHFEPLYAGLAVLFFASLFRGQTQWAVLPFALALLVREDAGLHLFGFLVLLVLCSWRVSTLRPWRRRLASFALAGLMYSAAVITLQKISFHGDNALHRIYLGDPIYAHVSAALIKQRLTYYFHHNKFILIPCLLVAALAGWRRSWLLLAGLVGVLPWLALNFLAKSDAAGNLGVYYSFPVLVMLAWPILIYPLDPRRSSPSAALLAGGMVLGSSLLMFAVERQDQMLTTLQGGLTPAVFPMSDYEQGRRMVLALEQRISGLEFETSVAGLYPMEIPARLVIKNGASSPSPKALVGFMGGWEHSARLLGAEGRYWYYSLTSPHLFILSQQPLPAGMITAFSLNAKGQVQAPYVFPNLILGPYAQIGADGSITDVAAHPDHVVEYGPYLPLAAGNYEVHFLWEATDAAQDDKLTFAVTIQSGRTVLAKTEISGATLRGQAGMQTTALKFSSTGSADEFEFVLHKSGSAKIRLKDVQVEKTAEKN